MFYTRKGDDGSSGLFGQDTRCNKDHPIFHALGTVDELNSLLGVCYAKAQLEEQSENIPIPDILRRVQEDLFIIQAELAGASKHVSNEHVLRLEGIIADIEVHIKNPNGFVISGSNELSAFLDFARSVARRAEREVLRADAQSSVSKDLHIYLNRLSSLLYVLARFSADIADVKEQNPSY
ncbi:cob(I)yrinic acid a,c-diamide adenosyltransferase [Candidatus Pacebacteria bacterium]|nr:cob(I)yrinic acid a,c-diamide adenosyltransferase [Candidatus Paceibacterota bacterium]